MQIASPFFAPYRQKKEDFFMSEKKVGKRLLTWVLVLVMTLSLLPLNVLAEENGVLENTNPSIVESKETRGAHLVKSATKDGDTYKIQLESWVTGKVEQTTGSAPLDIVLVLDQSGSMEGEKLSNLKAAVTNFVAAINADADAHNVEHHIAIVGFASNRNEGGSNYESGAWYNTGIFVNGKLKNYQTYQGQGQWENVYLASDSTPEEHYEYSAYLNNYSIFRTDIEYDAEKQEWGYWSGLFGNRWNPITPRTDENDNNPEHVQVEYRAKAGYIDLTKADYQAALVGSDHSDITTAIRNLSASGATRASYGMEMANNVFANNDLRDGSSRVVVFFTDGEPGKSGYETSEAGRAIAQAHATKNTYGAKVFSVGMFDTNSNDVNNFMDYVSSNYPSANASSNYWGDWTITPGGKDADKYYMTVEDGDLSAVFKQISGSILTSDVKADANTVLTDTLSQYFDFDGVTVENGTVTGVTVKKVAYRGNDTWATDGEDITSSVYVGLNGRTVTVRGFDYSSEDNVVTDEPSGYKLVVTFNVKPDTNCKNWTGSKPYETNNDKATLANDGEEPFATVASPKAFVDTYKVEYRFDETAPDGVNPPVDSRYYISGQQAEVKRPEKSSVDAGGYTYTFNGWKNGNDEVNGETIPISGNVTLIGTWTNTANTATYTVNYLWNGEPIPGATSAQKTAEYGTEVTEFPIEIEGYTPVKESETITIDADNSKNVINLNYYKNVTLTANSDTVTYDGQPHDGSPYSCDALGLLPDHMVKSVDYTCEPQTNVGEYDIELNNAKIVDADGKDVTALYQITYNYGKLTIKPCDVTVTIKGNTGTYEYDGTEKTVEGYTAKIDNNLYTEADFKLVDSQAKIRATVPDTYQMGLKPENFENTNPNFNVTFVVKPDGKLTIENRPITITANDVTGKYDGQPHGENGYSITMGSLVDGHAATVTISGSKTDAGEYEGLLVPSDTKIVDAKGKDVTSYYDISYEDGKLTITKRSVTLTSETASKVYDGTPLTKPEVTVTGDGFVDGEVTDIKATGTITDVGTVTNTIEYAATDKFKTDNYDITKNEGTLKVTPVTDKVTVTIKGNTKTVRYNGKEQSVTGFTYTAPEGVTVALRDSKAEAKGTDKGTYYMGLTKDDFTVSSEIYKEFEIIVNDGYLEITRSGGHHPRPKPTVEIEDDDALGLNTTDHFAYIVGYGNGEVRPQNNITRAEVATIFFRLLTDDVRDENLTKTNRYSDVTRADWYNTAVSTLSSMGIITGYPDGTFRPNAAITRAEFAAISARFDSNGDKTTAKFSDIATHWAKDEISIAYNNGWINGYPNGTFGPQRDITRAETMTLVNRVLNRQPETEDDLLPNMTVWTDNANPNAWYYLAVQEATNSHYYKFKTNSKYEKWTELRETRDWTQLEK